MREEAPKKRRRTPKKMTQERMERQALHYLQRYPASEAHFRRVMKRKIHRAHQAVPGDYDAYQTWLDATVSLCIRIGLLNDQALAQSLVRSYHRRGLSRRAIQQKLREKGFKGDVIET